MAKSSPQQEHTWRCQLRWRNAASSADLSFIPSDWSQRQTHSCYRRRADTSRTTVTQGSLWDSVIRAAALACFTPTAQTKVTNYLLSQNMRSTFLKKGKRKNVKEKCWRPSGQQNKDQIFHLLPIKFCDKCIKCGTSLY